MFILLNTKIETIKYYNAKRKYTINKNIHMYNIKNI